MSSNYCVSVLRARRARAELQGRIVDRKVQEAQVSQEDASALIEQAIAAGKVTVCKPASKRPDTRKRPRGY